MLFMKWVLRFCHTGAEVANDVMRYNQALFYIGIRVRERYLWYFLAIVFASEDWDYGGTLGSCKLNGQNNSIISNCPRNGKRGMEAIS